MIFFQIIFWVLVFSVFYSYIFYPFILYILQRKKKQNEIVYQPNDVDLPEVAILMAVHNEEKVIVKKIESVFETSYPLHKIKFYIGSDHSTDQTNEIINRYQKKYSNIYLSQFKRLGKTQIINLLEKSASEEILILTDANVYFERETIYHLIKHYKNPEISLVGGNIINNNFKSSGISFQEKFYLYREKIIKYYQGVIWGAMIGAFGGCYSLRKKNYLAVPQKFLVDDFFISMKVLQNGGKAINEMNAICFEDVSNKISEEFRRKVRISIGNYQNLLAFKSLLWPPLSKISFSFISYKVIKWLTPFSIIICLITNILLVNIFPIYKGTLLVQLFLLVIPLLDWILKSLSINLKFFRFITHFYAMNLALLLGFFKFINGVNSSIWKPTERNQ